MDLYWRDNNVCPTEEDYITMINHSTLFLPLLRLIAHTYPDRDGRPAAPGDQADADV